jgi:hypothetical protein
VSELELDNLSYLEVAKQINPGFSTADADYPEIHQVDGDLILRFKDWQERLIEVFFVAPVACKWEMLQSFLEGEGNDLSYEILNSSWLSEYVKQGIIERSEEYKHYKFNFNESGQFEVLANGYEIKIDALPQTFLPQT